MTPEQLASRLRDVEAPSCDKAAIDLRRLAAENAALRKAYRAMKNVAAGYSNYCEESASTRGCEREFTEAEELFRAALAGYGGEKS